MLAGISVEYYTRLERGNTQGAPTASARPCTRLSSTSPRVRSTPHGSCPQPEAFHRTGTKRFHHPVVGDLTLNFEALELAADPGQRLNIYTAEPGTSSHDALNLLASWITTPSELTTGADS